MSGLLADAHVDIIYYMMKKDKVRPFSELEDGPYTIELMKNTGVRLIICALYCEDKFNGEGSRKRLSQIIDFMEENLKSPETVLTTSEIDALTHAQEDMGKILLLENADALVGNHNYIEEIIKHGIRIVGLTHQGKNRLGDGCGVPYPDGITDEGREVIYLLIENGLIIDVAHLHPKCFWELMRMIESPIICSHTGVREIFSTPRNIDLEQAKEIIERGGIIGISFNPEMLSQDRKFSIELVFSHLDTLVQKFGPDGICIGSDLGGFDMTDKKIDINIVRELMDIMLRYGYGEDASKDILGLNLINYLKGHLI